MLDKIGKVITKIFGSKSEKDIKAIQPIVDKINALGPEMEKLSDEQLKAKTQEFKQKIKDTTAETSKKIEEVKAKMDDIENLSQVMVCNVDACALWNKSGLIYLKIL